ncbi:mechanosensitive ion channel [Chlorogloea sp. CCALA 695]|uniref:mechanosensitive ion channel n=1 Tax=Chlorogloea sp. CCALA 695 TaxID=2107693 RepID=UPI0018EA899A|nr:mechanosensitive ion channel [Chlorogloea sp. CCALA 695]
MNINLAEIIPIMGINVSIKTQQLLAQTPGIDVTQPREAVENSVNYAQNILQQLIAFIPNLLAAVAILLIGLIVAFVAKAIIKGLLNRTSIDNRIAASVMGRSDRGDLPKVEELIGSIVFWIVILFTVVAVLQTLQLEVVSRPLGNFLNQVTGFLPKLLGALIFLGVAWLVATVVKLITTRGLQAARLDERVNQQPAGTTPQPNQLSLSDTIGNALYWFIFLLFLIPILDTLGLQQALQPVQNLVGEILSILPNILAAVLIAGVGWLLAQVVRRIVTNLLATTGIDGAGERFGLRRTAGGQTLSGIIGTIIYVLILIPVAIAALNALQIDAISVPAIAMLQQILNALPGIFTAALILIVAYFIGHFLSDLVTSILTSLGFNSIFSALGLPSPTRQRTVSPPIVIPPPTTGSQTVLQPDSTNAAQQLATRTPSELVGIITLVGIMLFATLAAVNILNIPALTALVGGLVLILGKILSGLVVFGVGLFLANLVFNIITSSGDRQAQILAQVARIAIIAFVSALALNQIGIASDIVNLAFGLLLGALAVALALAFGLGGRDIAKEQTKELLDSFKQQRNQPPRT